MASDVPADIGQTPLEVARPDDGDLELWSVTTIIGVLDKPGLIWWSADCTADLAIDRAEGLADDIARFGRQKVFQDLRRARFDHRYRLSDTALGKVVHAACESYALSGRRPDLSILEEMVRNEGGPHFEGTEAEAKLIDTMLDHFDEWAGRFQPEYLATEVVVYNLSYGYAGQADAFLRVAGGGPYLIDYKSSRKPRDYEGRPKTPYPEAALQLAAYRWAERAAVWRPRRTEKFRRRVYLLSEAERDLAVPVPQVAGGLVLLITPESCEAFPVRCDRTVFRAYLYVQEAARWSFDLSRDVVGIPLVP